MPEKSNVAPTAGDLAFTRETLTALAAATIANDLLCLHAAARAGKQLKQQNNREK